MKNLSTIMATTYATLYSDAQKILDGIPFDLMDMAKKEYPNSDLILLAFDEEELNKISKLYIEEQNLPSMKGSMRWLFAMRLRFAAAFLYPFAKKRISHSSLLWEMYNKFSKKELLTILLIDLQPINKNIISEYLYIPEESFSAPIRLPWCAGFQKNISDRNQQPEEKN